MINVKRKLCKNLILYYEFAMTVPSTVYGFICAEARAQNYAKPTANRPPELSQINVQLDAKCKIMGRRARESV